MKKKRRLRNNQGRDCISAPPIIRIKVSPNHPMHQEIFRKKEENKERKLQGLHIHPSSSYYPSQSSQNCISRQALHGGCVLDSGELIFIFINHFIYRLWQYIDILILQLPNKPPLSFSLPQKNKSLPAWNRLPLSNKHKQRKHNEIVKKNCRVLVCAATEYCPLEGYFGRKEDWCTGCLRQH